MKIFAKGSTAKTLLFVFWIFAIFGLAILFQPPRCSSFGGFGCVFLFLISIFLLLLASVIVRFEKNSKVSLGSTIVLGLITMWLVYYPFYDDFVREREYASIKYERVGQLISQSGENYDWVEEDGVLLQYHYTGLDRFQKDTAGDGFYYVPVIFSESITNENMQKFMDTGTLVVTTYMTRRVDLKHRSEFYYFVEKLRGISQFTGEGQVGQQLSGSFSGGVNSIDPNIDYYPTDELLYFTTIDGEKYVVGFAAFQGFSTKGDVALRNTMLVKIRQLLRSPNHITEIETVVSKGETGNSIYLKWIFN